MPLSSYFRRGNSSKMKTPPATKAASGTAAAGAATSAAAGVATSAAGAKSVVDSRVHGLTAFDAFEAQLKGLCLKEYPCGIGSWVRFLNMCPGGIGSCLRRRNQLKIKGFLLNNIPYFLHLSLSLSPPTLIVLPPLFRKRNHIAK